MLRIGLIQFPEIMHNRQHAAKLRNEGHGLAGDVTVWAQDWNKTSAKGFPMFPPAGRVATDCPMQS